MTILINKIRKSKICKNKVIIPKTEIKNITIKTNLEKKVDVFPKDLSIKLYYKNKKMELKKTFTGGYGKVLLYKIDNFSVTIKIPLYDIYEEINIIEEYLKKVKNIDHYIIPYKIIYDDHNPFLITQEANGNLDDICWGEEDDKIKKQTILYIYKAMKFFYDNKLIYTDLKIENILYKCEDDGISLFFADIGSFEKLGNKNGIYSYPPLEDFKLVNKTSINTVKYLLGIIICEIYDLRIDKYFYYSYLTKGVKNYKYESVEEIKNNYKIIKKNYIMQYDKFVSKNPDLQSWIYVLLSYDINVRKSITMDEIHKKIKKL